MARRRRKTKTHVEPDPETIVDIPKSFIVKMGKVNGSVSCLIKDLRRMMEPNTASRLKERQSAKMRDYLHVAAQLNVTHCLVFTQTESSLKLRIGRVPRGPTLTFEVESFSLIKDVLGLQRRPKSPRADILLYPPLLVLNNFQVGDDHPLHGQMKLVATVFQNLLPPISVSTIKVSQTKRVILISYSKETGQFEIRHYTISMQIAGLSKTIKQLMHTRIPDLHKYNEIGDFVLREAASTGSESDADMEGENEVEITSAQHEPEKRGVKLVELGPRLALNLMQIDSGLVGIKAADNEVLYKCD